MKISRIDLNLYVVLEAVFSQGSITGAAKVLNLTQPAVSHAVNRLRERLDDPLFSRQGRQMISSPYTRRIMPEVRNALRILEGTTEKETEFDPAGAGKVFNIAIREMAETWLLSALVPYLRQHAPGIYVNSVQMSRRQMALDLASGSIDFSMDILMAVDDKVHYSPATDDAMAVVVSREHPRIRSEKDLDIEAYLAEEHIQVSSRKRGPGFEDHELARLGYRRNIALRCQNHNSACQVVSHSDLILTMQKTYATQLAQQIDNRILPMPVTLPNLNTYLYWHESMETDPAHRWLRKLIIKCARNS
ncbi:MAG: LysR family transcriptional regulator [Endozoicomonas sp.]